MYEIEIKFKFTNKTIDQIQLKLTNLNLKWSAGITQKDTIFLPKTMTDYKIVEGTQILRIREESSENLPEIKNILTMKVQQAIALESKEFESEIQDTKQIQYMIQELDFKEFVRVEKTRKKAKFNDYNLCLDEVKNLGVFLEVEFLSEEKVDANEIQKKIISWVESLGLTDYEINKIPYDTQTYLKFLGKK